jgi:hypothetical protein
MPIKKISGINNDSKKNKKMIMLEVPNEKNRKMVIKNKNKKLVRKENFEVFFI